jgi:hypothetical protein
MIFFPQPATEFTPEEVERMRADFYVPPPEPADFVYGRETGEMADNPPPVQIGPLDV